MLKNFLAGCIAFLCSQSLLAQTDSTTKSFTTFTGSLDAYYRYNFSGPEAGKTNNLTSFTHSVNSFELGMASLKVDHSYGKISATADLGIGRRAQEFTYTESGVNAIIKQAYISYAPSSAVKFTMGKWATHVGYEMVDAYANRNYSMSYGFSYGPFFHTGLKADIALGGKSALMVGIANTTDYLSAPSEVSYVLAQFSTASSNDKIKAYLNFQGSTELTQFNLVLTGALSDKLTMAYDGSVLTTHSNGVNDTWNSHAIYLNYDPIKSFGLSLRGDYFSDRKISPLVTTSGGSVFATTLSGNFRCSNLTIIPELRLDYDSDPVFSKNGGSDKKSTASFILAAVYKF
jgi:Putative beta-barrel porin-2, OmpL-like. bbp2